MSLSTDLASLRTLLEGVKEDLTEIKGDLKQHFKDDAKALGDQGLRLDRLEQTEKSRKKLLWTAMTAWVGVVVAWAWDRLGAR